MDSQASDNSQTHTTSPGRKALFERIPDITGPKEEVQLSMDDVAPSQLPKVESTIPEQPNPELNDKVPCHCEADLPEVICFVL